MLWKLQSFGKGELCNGAQELQRWDGLQRSAPAFGRAAPSYGFSLAGEQVGTYDAKHQKRTSVNNESQGQSRAGSKEIVLQAWWHNARRQNGTYYSKRLRLPDPIWDLPKDS